MPEPTTPDEALEQVVLSPKKTTVGNQTIEEFSVDELVKASQYLASQQAAATPHFGIRFGTIVNRYPGA